jgi:hypothetical protein
MSLAIQRELARDRLTEALAQLRRAILTAKADLARADTALAGLGVGSEPGALLAAVSAAQRCFPSSVAVNVNATDVANVVEVLAVLKAAAQGVA